MDNTHPKNHQEADAIQTENNNLSYKGFFEPVNTKPIGDFIEVFVSDWNKEHWAFYVYIDRDTYEDDIDAIWKLLDSLNWRDGDIYIELINHSDGLENFYKYLYDLGKYTQSDVLNKEYWEILEDKEDNHFLYFRLLNGSTSIDDLRDAEYCIFDDWYDALEYLNPDLYKALDESNALGCFDIEQFYNCTGLHEIDGCIVEEVC